MAGKLNKVPRFKLNNSIKVNSPGKNAYSEWREIYTKNSSGASDPVVSNDISNSQLPWMSLYKDYKDLLKIDLVTTIGYVEDLNNNKWSAEFIRGFPLLLQGPSSQFNPINGQSQINPEHWESGWTKYYEHVEDFSGNLQANNISDFFDDDNTPVITDFNNDETRNLVILDFNDDDEGGGLYLHSVLDNGNIKLFTSSGNNADELEYIHNKVRPKNIIVRLDTAVEDSSFYGINENSQNEWGLVTENENFWRTSGDNGILPKLYIFNYVYSGYVISPYDFMANFTTDYLRGFALTFLPPFRVNYLINKDNLSSAEKAAGRKTKATIQSILPNDSNGIIKISNDIDSQNNFSQKQYDDLKTPFRYNFHLFPNAIETKGLGVGLVEPASSSQPIVTGGIFWGASVKEVNNRINTIHFKYQNDLYIRKPTAPDNKYYIENIIWSSLSTARHVVYAASWITRRKRNYLGNYLNINELEYNSDGDLSNTTQNPDFAPKSGKASGVIIRNHIVDTLSDITTITPLNLNTAGSKDLMHGINEINMARKTLTPYYKVDTQAGATYSYENYAFNWNDTSQSWSDKGTSGIDSSTEKIDVSNHVVVEYRNLVRLKTNIKINYKFYNDNYNNPVKTTFLPANKTWLNNTQLSNNDVQYVANSTGTPIDESNTRLLSAINNSGEYFEISWEMDNGNVAANTKKYGYLLDVASGRHEMPISYINWSTTSTNTWITDSTLTDTEKEKYQIISNVFQIRIGEVNNINASNNINNELISNNTLNFSLDSNGTKIALYKIPSDLITSTSNQKVEKFPFFCYLNFIGIRNSMLIGNSMGESGWAAIKGVFKKINLARGPQNIETRNPYIIIDTNNVSRTFQNSFQNAFNMYYNPNLFYARSNFIFSNVKIQKSSIQGNVVSDNEILFLNDSPNVKWKATNNGLNITNISSNPIDNTNTDKTKGISFFVFPNTTELFITSLLGKVSRDSRTLNNQNAFIETPSIELNNNLELKLTDLNGDTQINNFNCFRFEILNFCASQKNRFIPDFWKWNNILINSKFPNEIYNGPPNTIIDRNLRNRYNVYNWNVLSSDIQVDNSIYDNGQVHNPQFAFENQTLIHFNIEVSTITTNFSHILVNTWRGARNTNNKFQSIGIKSEVNNAGEFEIVDNPVMKIKILGGNIITPSISDTAVILDVDPTAKFNYATDTDTNDPEGKSKAPRKVPEGNGNLVDFTNTPFTENSTNKGWFAETGFDSQRKGIFAFKDTNNNVTGVDRYQTNDLSANVLESPPTNLTLKTSNLFDDIKGTFSEEEQEFPFEFLFCYPIEDPPVPKPDGHVTTYTNLNNEVTTTTFDNYKGYKRYSNLYAISLKGSNTGFGINNENFRDRNVFPNIIIINCVELPPPVQVNNTFDMVADDNRSVKIVWKGYNFSKPQGDFRSKYGNSGDIVWTITREQTQLGIRKKLFEEIIEPDQKPNGGDNYNLSTYTFTDTDVRIYDKYIYTISGTFVYSFKRTSVDLNSTTLSLSFGSFITPEVIICKNNKFEFGRYNTTSDQFKII